MAQPIRRETTTNNAQANFFQNLCGVSMRSRYHPKLGFLDLGLKTVANFSKGSVHNCMFCAFFGRLWFINRCSHLFFLAPSVLEFLFSPCSDTGCKLHQSPDGAKSDQKQKTFFRHSYFAKLVKFCQGFAESAFPKS